MAQKPQFVRAKWFILLTGILLGALTVLTIRFVTYKPVAVHYHANFALYIQGQREEFKAAKYYQEVAVCSASEDITLPEQRVHMHENINSVVHIHDHAVTWGSFFTNLGWTVGADFIQTADGKMYSEDEQNKLYIILNGQDYTGLTPITNMVIKNEDKLLVSYGSEADTKPDQQFKTVPMTAHHHNSVQDPASCAGSHKVTFKDRLKHLF